MSIQIGFLLENIMIMMMNWSREKDTDCYSFFQQNESVSNDTFRVINLANNSTSCLQWDGKLTSHRQS